jgi:hypothetical protein
VSTSNSPTAFVAAGLPEGLSTTLDAGVGKIVGQISSSTLPGDYQTVLTISNANGSDQKTITLRLISSEQEATILENSNFCVKFNELSNASNAGITWEGQSGGIPWVVQDMRSTAACNLSGRPTGVENRNYRFTLTYSVIGNPALLNVGYVLKYVARPRIVFPGAADVIIITLESLPPDGYTEQNPLLILNVTNNPTNYTITGLPPGLSLLNGRIVGTVLVDVPVGDYLVVLNATNNAGTSTFTFPIKITETLVEKAYEGSLMRVYYFNDKWNISTKKCLDANNAHWIANKSFYELFMECLPENFNIDLLNKDYCYSLLLCHPNNNIITKDKPHLIHLNTRSVKDLKLVEHDLGFNRPFVYTGYNKDNIRELYNKLNDEYEGYIIIDKNNNRQKIEGKMFRFLKDLWGNTNNRIYRYFELRKDENILINYLTYFKEDALIFKNIEIELIHFFKKIHNLYLERHVKKTNIYLDYPYSTILYKLHGNYMSNKKPITHSSVVLHMNSLNINLLYRYYIAYINNVKNKTDIGKYYVKGFYIYNSNLPELTDLPDLIDDNGEINNN